MGKSQRDKGAAGGVYLLGLDPGLAHCGWCIAEARSVTNYHVIKLGVISTKKAGKRSNVRSSADTGRRALEVYRALRLLCDMHKPRALLIEAFSAARNATNAAKTARAYGTIDALAEELRAPIFESSPMDIKGACTGQKTATKEAVEKVVRQLCTDEAIETLEASVAEGQRNHAFDAVGAVVAGIDLPEFRYVLPIEFDEEASR